MNAQLIMFTGGKQVKGRGATDIDLDTSDRYAGESGEFQEVPAEGDKSGPQRCTFAHTRLPARFSLGARSY